MKHPESANKLVIEMRKLIEVIKQHDWAIKVPELDNQTVLRTGDVLGALEVFTFANFNEGQQSVIFSRARTVTEPTEKEPETQR
ncbi:Uncharacterised protein [uncultured archaeon]|nr:Uncharacterised protein [uncultured archaeon]